VRRGDVAALDEAGDLSARTRPDDLDPIEPAQLVWDDQPGRVVAEAAELAVGWPRTIGPRRALADRQLLGFRGSSSNRSEHDAPVVPPKPKLFDRIGPGSHSLATPRTISSESRGLAVEPTVGG